MTASSTRLWTRDYALWFLADAGSSLGSQLHRFAVPLIAMSLTGSAALSGLLASSTAVITTVVGLVGGVIIDRFNRKKLMASYSVLSTLLWAAAAALIVTDLLTFSRLIVVVIVAALLFGLMGNATNAALRELVSQENYPRAQAANRGRDATISLASGPLGGLLYAIAAWIPFAGTAISFALFGLSAKAISVSMGPKRLEESSDRPGVSSIARDVIVGARWFFGRPLLWQVILAAVPYNFAIMGIYQVFIYTLIQDGGTSYQLGLLSTCAGGGVIVGALIAGRLVSRISTGRLIPVMNIAAAVLLCIALVCPSFPMMLVVLALTGVCVPITESSGGAFVFSSVPSELQGRVGSFVILTAGLLSAFAPAVCGYAVESLGYAAGTGLCLCSCLLAAILFLSRKRLRHIGTPEQWHNEEL